MVYVYLCSFVAVYCSVLQHTSTTFLHPCFVLHRANSEILRPLALSCPRSTWAPACPTVCARVRVCMCVYEYVHVVRGVSVVCVGVYAFEKCVRLKSERKREQ